MARCDEILGRPEWDDRIAVGLLEEEPQQFWRAKEAARLRGLDTYDVHVQRIRQDPWGSEWFDAWQQADAARAVELTELARESLPLDHIAAGPADELGLGPGWEAHERSTGGTGGPPGPSGVDADLVLVGLRESCCTPEPGHLAAGPPAWPVTRWPSSAREMANLRRLDPNGHARELAAEVLRAPGRESAEEFAPRSRADSRRS